MAVVSERIRAGLVELRTKRGSVYVSPSLWERVCLLWTFRNFHSLPKQVLNHREQRLIDNLCRTGIVRRAPDSRTSLIGAVENVELLLEAKLEAPTSSGKLLRMTVPLRDAVAPKAVGSEGLSIPSDSAVGDLRADWGFSKRPNNVHSIAESRPYFGEEGTPKQTASIIWSRNRLASWGRWALGGAFALTLVWILLHYRHPQAASMVETQSAINLSQPLPRRASVNAASALSQVVTTATTQPAIIRSRTQLPSAMRAPVRDPKRSQTGPTKAVASPQPAMANDESIALKARPQRLQIVEAPTSFAYPIVPDPSLTGRVSLKAVIGRDGTVTTVDALSGKPALAKAALRAVKHWHYRIQEVDGNAIEAETTIEINFHGDEVVSLSYPGAH